MANYKSLVNVKDFGAGVTCFEAIEVNPFEVLILPI